MHPIKIKNQWFLYHDDLNSKPNENWFDAQYWSIQGRLLGTYSGRGSVWIIKSDLGKWVLKHYYRGGLYARISRDKYFWSGLQNTRAVSEFNLLQYMYKRGLPCPKPIAVRVKKTGLFYTNDLITQYIQHKTTFAKKLVSTNTKPDLWAQIGQVIASFHIAGINHADLNAHNLLIDDNTIHLIDFDKGQRMPHQKNWPQANIARLKRSIEKETGRSCARHYAEHWHALVHRYQKAMADYDSQ